jgi:DNA adenine methylase
MFINIQKNPKELYEILQPMIEHFHKADEIAKERYYYQLREYYNTFSEENKKTSTASAIFIFLNKTGFRGLYREGPKGYNVPYGHYKNPEIINYEHLMEVSSLIQNVEFQVMDFSDSLNEIFSTEHNKSNSNLIYLDPPYVPLNSKSFTKYNESDFSLNKHNSLFEMCQSSPISFIMSNSDTQLIRSSFNQEKYTIDQIECKRSINSKNPGEKAMEVIISFQK